MSEKIIAFVREIVRQRDLLLLAHTRDEYSTTFYIQDRNAGFKKRPGYRKQWTLRDERFFEADDGDGSIPLLRTKLLANRLIRPELATPSIFAEAASSTSDEDLLLHIRDLAWAHGQFMKYYADLVSGNEIPERWNSVTSEYDTALRNFADAFPNLNEQI